ncbi:hypothetical protein L208DRAFT_1412951 [Tricholoma matsutake]|nr:hypothetical protein L208DRAFT_1412951 [Tricholoma matsutake 945]
MSAFGNTSGGTSGNLFGGTSTTTTPATNSTNNTGQPSIFGDKSGGLFGGNTTSGTNTGGLFGSGSAPVSGSLFGGGSNTTTATPSILGGGTTTNTTLPSTTPAATTTTTTSSNSLFGGGFNLPKPADQSATTASKPAGSSFFSQPPTTGSTPAAAGGLFGAPSKPTDSTTPATANAPTPSNNLFGGGSIFGKPVATSTSSATSATSPAASGGLFSNLSATKSAETKDSTTPTSNLAPPTFNLFGGAKTDDKKDAPAAPPLFGLGQTTATTPAEASSLTKPNAPVAGSTAPVVAVPPPSMLRGKTIEEIVNRWSAELETHVREFNRFAGEVAVWDRALIENGHNFAALYSHVQGAEREQNDIDQSLDHIEQQQKELASTLTAYEKVTQEILGSQGGSLRALDSGPADTERDKNYMLATDLHTHLDDLSGSLTQMIDSVNALSLPSNDTASADDPMAQIAQILSSHLESLQWIDGAVREVESKVSDVEKRVKDSGHGTVNGTGQKNRGFGLYR